ncbi:MAG: hypothetical protein GY953_40760 [bacterium]|nr:hypothetical protein [bacterium]
MTSCIVLLAASASAQTVVGLFPTYPPKGPLAGKTPDEQARYFRSIGVTLAGGPFKDAAVPNALRKAGIKTAGLVVLFHGEQHWKSHPESRPVMADGKPLFKDRWYAGLCPNQPYLRREKLAQIERMLASGWYDYINLDFIRYPVHWEVPSPRIPDTCYDPVCLAKFQRDTGITIPGDLTGVPAKAQWIKANHGEAWYRWRADQITAFCTDVKKLRDRISPDTLIGVAAVPWRPADYDDAIHKVVAQDFPALAKVVDVFNPMSYHVLNNRPITWIGEVTAYLVEQTGRPVWPFVIFADDKPLSAAEWRQTFNQALSNGSEGLIAFPFDRAAKSEGYRVFQELFR